MAVVKVHLLSVHIIHHVSGMCLTVFRNLAVYLLITGQKLWILHVGTVQGQVGWGFGQPGLVGGMGGS